MTEQNKDFRKVICWGCRKALTYEGQFCPSCGEPGIVALPQPKEIMPFCGNSKDSLLNDPMEKPCCHCGRIVLWESDENWIKGPCPHCGARGFYGIP